MIAMPDLPGAGPVRGMCGHGSSVARPNGSANTFAPMLGGPVDRGGPPSGLHDSCTTMTSASKPRSTSSRS